MPGDAFVALVSVSLVDSCGQAISPYRFGSILASLSACASLLFAGGRDFRASP